MRSIERAFAVLGAIAGRDESVGLSEIARATGLPKSTTSRILASLDELSMVERLGDRYALGAGLATLTASAAPTSALPVVAEPHLVELAEHSGEAALLAIRDGDDAVYRAGALAPGAVQVKDWTGERFPLHTIADGLVMMTTWSEADLRAYARRGLVTFTDATVSTATALLARVREARHDGVAWTYDDFDEDVTGVAAPITLRDGRIVGAINISGPSFRFPGNTPLADITEPLIAACDQIAERL